MYIFTEQSFEVIGGRLVWGEMYGAASEIAQRMVYGRASMLEYAIALEFVQMQDLAILNEFISIVHHRVAHIRAYEDRALTNTVINGHFLAHFNCCT